MTLTTEDPASAEPDLPDAEEAPAPDAGDDSEGPAERGWIRNRWTWRVGALVALAIVIALVVVVIDQAGAVSDDRQRDKDGKAAVAAASAEVVNLTTVSAKDSAESIRRLLAGAAPSFQKEFKASQSAFENALKNEKVVSKGVVDSAGLVSLGGNKATVLVAASATVTNTNTKSPETRTYRLKVSVERISGKWLVSEMSFVA